MGGAEVGWSIVPDEVLVGLRTETRIADVGPLVETVQWPAAMGPVSADSVERVYSIPKWQDSYLTVVKVDLPETLDVYGAITELEPLESVAFAEPNGFFLDGVIAAEPDDPQFTQHPVPGEDERWYHDRIDSPGAWQWFQDNRGEDAWGGSYPDPQNPNETVPIVLAVIDVGVVDQSHEDLADNVVFQELDEWVEDHPTHVAGIAAAVTDNTTGVAGVAGQANIMSWDAAPLLDERTDAFEEATDAGAHIVNTSLGGIPDVPGLPTFETYRNGVDSMYLSGVLHFNAAYNEYNANMPHLNYEQTLYVAATDRDDLKPAFSNYGHGVDISAPGLQIYSTSKFTPYYAFKDGTSMASPMAAGVAALIWSQHPEWSEQPDWSRDQAARDKVAAQLLATTDYIDDLNAGFVPREQEDPTGLWGMLGTGRVNAGRAINETLAPPRIEGIREIPYDIQAGMTQLTVDLANVFETSTWGAAVYDPELDRSIYHPEPGGVGPIDDPNNWQLVRDTDDDGDFDDESPIALTLDFTALGDYSDILGYKIGTNDLRFSFPGLQNGLPAGRYRFTAFAKATGRDNGLQDPFGTALDGNADGTGGDDYVRDFWIGLPTLSVEIDANALAPNLAGDGQDDFFELKLSSDKQGYLDVFIHGDSQSGYPNPTLVDSLLLLELEKLIVHGSTDNDTITVEYLGEEFGVNAQSTILIDGTGGGADSITAYGSPGDDLFGAEPGDVSLEVASRYSSAVRYTVTTITDAGQGLTAVGSFTAYGGEGSDAADLTDAATDDLFENWLDGQIMLDGARLYDPVSLSFDYTASGFDQVYASAENGGDDLAKLHGAGGGDTFRGYFNYATLLTGNLSLAASGFEQIQADTSGELDSAHLYYRDSGEGHLVIDGDSAKLTAETTGPWSNEAVGFNTVYLHSRGDDDNPDYIDGPQFDLFFFHPDQVFFWDEGGDGVWAQYLGPPENGFRWFNGDGVRWEFVFPDDEGGDVVVETDTVTVHLRPKVRRLIIASGAVAIWDNMDVEVHSEFRVTGQGAYMAEVNSSGNAQVILVPGAPGATAYLEGTFEVRLVDGYDAADIQEPGGSGTIVESRTVIVGAIASGTQFASPPQFLGLDIFVTGEVQQNNVDVDAEFLQALGGDTDGDRDVDFADFNTLANNYTGPLPPGTGGKIWIDGDFDFDADVDDDDLDILAANYTGSGGDYTQGGAAAGRGGGGGESALFRDMLARNYAPPPWMYDWWLARVYELQPLWVDQLGQILAQDESSKDGPSAEAVDKLLELLAINWP